MIIYGWGYFNRRDHSVVRGPCRSCRRQTYLKSYTSSKFFTLYFIPVIPLGKQKIVNDCPHCKKAYGMPFGQWKKLLATDLPRAVAEYEQRPAHEETAKKMLGTIISAQDRPTLQRVGPQIHRAFAQNAKMLCLLGYVYGYLCMDKEADVVYLEAVGLTDDPGIAADANAHLEAQRLRPPTPPNRLLQSLPVLIIPLALLFGVATFLQQAFTSRPKYAYVVNGLSHPYSVVINGEEVRAQAFERVRAPMIKYGSNNLRAGDHAAFLAATTFTADASWWSRVFDDPVIIVNPDQAAVVIWERSGYSSGPVPDSAYQFRTHVGQVVHIFPNIDYPFQDFPGSITTDRSGLNYRTRVSILDSHDIDSLMRVLLSNKQAATLNEHLRARLRADDGGDGLVYYAAQLLPADEFQEFARPRLEARPVQMAWHRAYQNRFEGTSEGGDLEAHYRGLAEKEPDNSAIAYLWSRMVDDPDACTAILERAITMPHPSGYAFYGLAYRRMIDGDYASARADCDQALSLEPEVEQIRDVRTDTLYGLHDYETIERETGNLLLKKSSDFGAFFLHLYRMGKLHNADTAETEIPLFLGFAHGSSSVSPAQRASEKAYFETALALAAGDRQAYAKAADQVNDPHYSFQADLMRGDLASAVKRSHDESDPAGLLGHLTLYALLMRAGQADDAHEQLEPVVKHMADGTSTQKRWAAWLQGDTAPDARFAANECYDVDNHAVYLAALAARFPAHASEYLDRARLINYRDSAFTLALTDVLTP